MLGPDLIPATPAKTAKQPSKPKYITTHTELFPVISRAATGCFEYPSRPRITRITLYNHNYKDVSISSINKKQKIHTE